MKNTGLVEYGIAEDESDIRIHVCVLARKLYLYSTRLAQARIKIKHFRTTPVITTFWENGRGIRIITAEGLLIPPDEIFAMPYDIPENLLTRFDENSSTSEKGKKACSVVTSLLQNMYPLMNEILDEKLLSQEEVNDMEEQIKGNDISIRIGNAEIQIKCDYRGGSWEDRQSINRNITGNLFVQTHECNPNKDV